MVKSSWNDYRRHRRRFHAIWFAGLTVVAAITILALPRFGGGAARFLFAAGPLFLFAWLVAALTTGFDFVRRFACPKCGGPFFARRSYVGTLQGRCAQCGAPKWSEPAG